MAGSIAEMVPLTATVALLEVKPEGLESHRSLGALKDLRRLERFQSYEGSDEKDHNEKAWRILMSDVNLALAAGA